MRPYSRLAAALRRAALFLLLAAMPAAAETARPADADSPAMAWEYRFDFAALTRTHLAESYESAVRALRVASDGTVVAAITVQTASSGSPPPGPVLSLAKLSADGKLLWAKVFPAVPADQISLGADIGGGRIAVFASPPESAVAARGRNPGRILVLRPDGSIERNIALQHPGPALVKERGAIEPNQFVLTASPGSADGLIIFGEYGPGPASWYLGAIDRTGRRLWEHSGWSAPSILTRVHDARLAPGGKIEALNVRGPLSEQHPANGVFETYDAGGRLVARKELERGRFGCYRFADERTIVAKFEKEIVWMRPDGTRLRTLAIAEQFDCEFTQAPDGTLVWADTNYDRKEMNVYALAPGGDRPSMTLIANGSRAAAASRGGFVAVLSAGANASKDEPIVIRRYGAP